MVTLEQLEDDHQRQTLGRHLLPVDAGLAGWPVIRLEPTSAAGFRNGNPQPIAGSESGWVRVYDRDECLLGLGKCTEEGLLKPKRVFNLEAE